MERGGDDVVGQNINVLIRQFDNELNKQGVNSKIN
jgi:hypothetical protein